MYIWGSGLRKPDFPNRLFVASVCSLDFVGQITSIFKFMPNWNFSIVADSMLVSVVGMALYTGYVFMPQHIMAILHYFEIVQ